MPTSFWTWVLYALLLLVVVLAGLTWILVRKNRPFTAGDVFRASRRR